MADMEITQDVVDFFEEIKGTSEVTPVQDTMEVTTPTEETEVETTEPAEEQEQVETEPVSEEEPSEEQETETEVEEEVEQEEDPAETDWEKRYKDLQAHTDRQLAESNRQLAELQQWAQSAHAWQQQVIAERQQEQQQVQQAQVQVSPEQVAQQLDMNPVGTFQWIAHNRPDLMPNVITMVRGKENLGDQVADAMLVEFQQFQLAQYNAQQEQRFEQAAAQNQPAPEVGPVMEQIVHVLEERHGEPFKALNADIAAKATEAAPAFQQYMQSNGLEITPAAIADFVTQIYLDIREEKLNQKAAAPAKPVKLTPAQHVEQTGGNVPNQATPDDDAINEILQGARALGVDVSAPASV